MAKLEKLACVNCGAMLDVDIDLKLLTCAFCGTRLLLERETDGVFKTGLVSRKRQAEAEQWLERIGAGSTGDPELTIALDLSGKRIDAADMRYFLYFPNLTFLNLNDTSITDEHLPGLGHLVSLVHLYASDNGITDLSFTSQMEKLETLVLMHTRVADAGLVHLEGMKKLRALDLEGTDVTDAGMRSIAGIESLEELRIDGTMVTVEGLKRLKGNARIKRLDYPEAIRDIDMLRADIMELCGTKTVIGFIDEGVTDEDLKKLDPLGRIETLWLMGNKITDAGLEIISKHRHIEDLDLSRNRITDRGLAQLEGMKRLRRLDLTGTKVSGRGVKRLKEALPSAKISF